jgi:sterol desaturase/sphingolipid hydroxylase (fatty acid hydroxylase superfamily)
MRLPLDCELIVRLGAFASGFLVIALWEMMAPRRARSLDRLSRWPGNVGVVVLDTLLVRVLFPTAAVGVALMAEARGWGLFNLLSLPAAVSVIASVLLLDLAIWAQHALFHWLPILWRLHRMHHADLDVDVTTGIRFHPLEILLSLFIKFAVVTTLGAPALAVLIFEVLLNLSSMFNHANIRLAPRLDRIARLLVVTPDMHRVHHSISRLETDSNFGFNFPWWDRLFGTYRAQPEAGHDAMIIGIEGFRDTRELRLDRMLLQPFRGPEPPSPDASTSAVAQTACRRQ